MSIFIEEFKDKDYLELLAAILKTNINDAVNKVKKQAFDNQLEAIKEK